MLMIYCRSRNAIDHATTDVQVEFVGPPVSKSNQYDSYSSVQ